MNLIYKKSSFLMPKLGILEQALLGMDGFAHLYLLGDFCKSVLHADGNKWAAYFLIRNNARDCAELIEKCLQNV